MSASIPPEAPASVGYTPPAPSRRVLPTLNNDGTRRWVRTKTYAGPFRTWRGIVAWTLIATFIVLPFINMNGRPLVLLDVPGREFTLFGTTFLPTDGVLLMLLTLIAFIAIFLFTAALGRVWCGWACPQTVYMEFVFRPIEQWLEGSRGRQLKLDKDGPDTRRILKYVVYAILSVFVGNVFLAYFVGVERLAVWATMSPFEHPTPFLIVLGTAALVFFDFAYFREQMCTVVCPYARLQSVLLDEKSLIVAYDEQRGEPRGGGRRSGGDCIDCKACVVACPTGIDIRNGLQLECIACTACIDACDSVMKKVKKPPGLIKYTNGHWLSTGELGKLVRTRVMVYPLMLVVLLAALFFFGARSGGVEVTVLRGIGAPFSVTGEMVQNQLRIKLRNRSSAEESYALSISGVEGAELVAPENPVTVPAGEQVTTGVFVLLPMERFTAGVLPISVVITSNTGEQQRVGYKLLGPSR